MRDLKHLQSNSNKLAQEQKEKGRTAEDGQFNSPQIAQHELTILPQAEPDHPGDRGDQRVVQEEQPVQQRLEPLQMEKTLDKKKQSNCSN